jgi:uncharacterized protein
MSILSLNTVSRGPVRIREEIPADEPVWLDRGLALAGPVHLDLEARSVGEGVLVRGTIRADLDAQCRRCLVPVSLTVEDTVDLLYEPLSDDEAVDLGGEVYPLPERGDELNLTEALQEQLLLRIPDFVVCAESCRGLCRQCGAELNRTTCACVPDQGESPWGALKKIKFD